MNDRSVTGIRLIKIYSILDRRDHTFRNIMSEYGLDGSSLEISFLTELMDSEGLFDDSRINGYKPEMMIVQNDEATTTSGIYRSLAHHGYRPIRWPGLFVFGAQYPADSLRYEPVAIGGKPLIWKYGRGEKEADFAQLRQEHQGRRETDLDLSIGRPNKETGLWSRRTSFLVATLKKR